ncbi:unnamed protein product [Arabis nemorensis]|uniref:Cytochrome P450 n=1 Tax=Arabis nemorensis TaxID=586526 RepID=A0A565BZH7_9BRAS|nr:unnamed protein product [Arabis nemorensis]
MGDMDHESLTELQDCWNFFPTSGWFQLPLDIPGSRFYQLLQGRKQMMKILGDMVSMKIASGERVTDFMEIIFSEMGCQGESRSRSVEKAVEYIFSFFIVASETTPRFLAAILKLVSGNPRVQQELQREHSDFTQVTWEDYKGMTFTHMVRRLKATADKTFTQSSVINEALRITSTGPTVFRRTSQDYQIGGYRIPKGWIFMGYPLVHFNELYYENPFAFNPWRWKVVDERRNHSA